MTIRMKLFIDLLLDHEILPLIELPPVCFPSRNGDSSSGSMSSFGIAGLVGETSSDSPNLLMPGNYGFG